MFFLYRTPEVTKRPIYKNESYALFNEQFLNSFNKKLLIQNIINLIYFFFSKKTVKVFCRSLGSLCHRVCFIMKLSCYTPSLPNNKNRKSHISQRLKDH